MKRMAFVLILGLGATIAHADEYDTVLFHDIFRPTDPLAQRDEYGLVHQGPHVNATDFAPRYHWRWAYSFKVPEQLFLARVYFGSMQPALAGRGFYCGPVDGVFIPGVADAIARLQRNYSCKSTGRF